MLGTYLTFSLTSLTDISFISLTTVYVSCEVKHGQPAGVRAERTLQRDDATMYIRFRRSASWRRSDVAQQPHLVRTANGVTHQLLG